MDFLSGKKTYAIGGLIVIAAICYALGMIENETFLKLLGILLGTGTVTMRQAVAKIEKK